MAKIKDVAKHADVSVSTVSYVLSGKRPISKATRERVLASIQELGYQPHAGASALAGNRTNVIGLVAPLRAGVYVPVIMQFVTAVTTRAREQDRDILLLTKDEGEDGLRRVQERSLADALIVMDVELHDKRVSCLRSLRLPSVLIGYPLDAEGLTCVDTDFAAAGATAVDHLADLGHRCVGLIGSPYAVYQRETGFATRVMAGLEGAARRRHVVTATHPCDPRPDDVRAAVADLLASHPGLTGLIIHNEAVVETVLVALAEHGRSVPDDVSVIVIGPPDLGRRFGLSAVELPFYDVGRRAVELVVGRLDGGPTAPSTLLPPRLCARGSTGRPAAVRA